MGGGGPQATRIPENPVGTSGIASAATATGSRPERPARSPRRVASLLLPPLALMGLIWFLSAQPDLSSGLKQDFLLRKIAHGVEFGLLTVLWARAGAGLWRTPWRVVVPVAAAVALAWAAVDERHQHFVEGRVGSLRDIGIDAIGIVVAVALLRWSPVRRRVGVVVPGRRPDDPGRAPGTTTGREVPAGDDGAARGGGTGAA